MGGEHQTGRSAGEERPVGPLRVRPAESPPPAVGGPAPLDAEEDAAWRGFLEFGARLLARLDAELVGGAGLSLADYEVLVHLSEAPGGALRMSELAEATVVSRSGLTRRVDALVGRGLLCRRGCPSDHRGTYAVLTDCGRAQVAAAAPVHLAGVRAHLFDLLSPEEVAVLARVLPTLAAALRS